jgi:hypothetical protein
LDRDRRWCLRTLLDNGVVVYDPYPPMATLRAGSLKITLAQQVETMLRRGRGAHFFIGVTDVDEFYEQVRLKTEVVDPPTDEGWGGRFVTLEDPDKYRYFFVTWTKNESDNDR